MWKDQLEKDWNENPLKVLAITALVANASARLLNAWSAAKGRRAYAKHVNYRVKR